MQEIKPSDEPIFWVARNDDSTVVHAGVTLPGQVTTTGQPVLIQGSRNIQVAELSRIAGDPPYYNYQFIDGGWRIPAELIFYVIPASLASVYSSAVYDLIYPGQVGMFAQVIPHNDRNHDSLLQCQLPEIVPISVDANTNILVDLLSSYSDSSNIISHINTHKGLSVDICDMLPQSWKDNAISLEEAVNRGYPLLRDEA